MTATAQELPARVRVAYQQRGTGWEGVLRDESGAVVRACGHYHHNRDQETTLHSAARVCAIHLAIAEGYRAEASYGTPWWSR